MKINTKRLALLAYYLASVPNEEFNIISWRKCAIGWATKIPEFVKLGFCMDENYPIAPVYHSHENWKAVQKFFGLSEFAANYLFSMYSYKNSYFLSPMRVVCRIKKFIKTNKEV